MSFVFDTMLGTRGIKTVMLIPTLIGVNSPVGEAVKKAENDDTMVSAGTEF